MKRTAERPLPQGGWTATIARDFGDRPVGRLGAADGPGDRLAGRQRSWPLSIVYYAVVYTIWLKPRTPQNIVIGGGAGAFPPLIGWVAVTGDITLMPMLLFAIIFIWTPPHFWALALFVKTDYAKVGIPMMPVVAGEKSTRRQILVYSAAAAAAFGLRPGGSAARARSMALPRWCCRALFLAAGAAGRHSACRAAG